MGNALGAAQNISLMEVESCLAERGWRREFPRNFEDGYREYSCRVRERALKRGFWPLMVIYNVLLITDIMLLPQTAWLSTLLHFAVVTPAIAGLHLLYFGLRDPVHRQIVEAAIPILIVGQIMLIFSLNSTPQAGQYQYFVSLLLMYMNINQRLDMRIARGATALIILIYACAMLSSSLPFEVKLACSSFILVVAYVMLQANLRIQYDARYAFLVHLRELLQLNAAVEIASHDVLTGLYNRRYLEDFAKDLPPAADGYPTAVAMLLLDVDFFKAYNDKYGHQQGDRCLRQVADCISKSLNPDTEFGIRFGGEEFLILLAGADEALAKVLAGRIRREIEALSINHAASSVASVVTVSIGVAAGYANRETLDLLIAQADAALYLAKKSGRNQIWPPVAQATVAEELSYII
jgi:diguanylate cyclase (GGDEF)-like protein